MSLADISCLLELCAGKPDPGDPLNRAAQSEGQPLRDLRLAGLRALFETPALRHSAMRSGLGL